MGAMPAALKKYWAGKRGGIGKTIGKKVKLAKRAGKRFVNKSLLGRGVSGRKMPTPLRAYYAKHAGKKK